ncbi:hypothetical protein [Microcoleus sp. S13C4]|uniref:hypothetical protein n=1 Tax=Microcoleus sp. S13C4 TaxID=3055410 RepID=UPI002FD2C012
MVSQEKKQRFSELLKYIRGLEGVKKFAARLGIKLPTYSAWETARAFPSDPVWELLLPQLCQMSGLAPELIEAYLRGDWELTDLEAGLEGDELRPRTRSIMTFAKFRAWLRTLSLIETIQVLQDAAKWADLLALQGGSNLRDSADRGKSPDAKADPPKAKAKSNSQLLHFEVNPSDKEALVKIICQLAEDLSLESLVRVDNRLRDLILFNLQELGLLQMREYQSNTFYLLMEEYRVKNSLSYEQFEERILREGKEAGLEATRIAKIIRGQLLPDNRELLWIGIFIRKPDGNLYDHEELIALRDGPTLPDSEGLDASDVDTHFSHRLAEDEPFHEPSVESCKYNGK